MLIVGLTGSIAMGKSKTASIFKDLGYKVFDADQAVHDLYANDLDIIKDISEICPIAIIDNKVNRQALSECIAKDSTIIKNIEAVVHPRIQILRNEFIKVAEQQGSEFVLLDIPLLFETGREDEVDKIIVVTTSPEIQRQRALDRPNLSKEKFEWILSKQLSDSEKRKRADFIVDTSVSVEDATLQVKKIVAILDPS